MAIDELRYAVHDEGDAPESEWGHYWTSSGHPARRDRSSAVRRQLSTITRRKQSAWHEPGSHAVWRQDVLHPTEVAIDYDVLLERSFQDAVALATTSAMPALQGSVYPRPEGVMAELIELLGTQSSAISEAIVSALREQLTGQGAIDDEDVWGPLPPVADVASAAVRNEARAAARQTSVIAGSLTQRQAAALMQLGEAAISQLVASSDLASVTTEGRNWFPAWQFDSASPIGLVAGIRELHAAFARDTVSLSIWLVRPNWELAGETPLSFVRDGRWREALTAVPAEPGL